MVLERHYFITSLLRVMRGLTKASLPCCDNQYPGCITKYSINWAATAKTQTQKR